MSNEQIKNRLLEIESNFVDEVRLLISDLSVIPFVDEEETLKLQVERTSIIMSVVYTGCCQG
jgi:hypothetical protein